MQKKKKKGLRAEIRGVTLAWCWKGDSGRRDEELQSEVGDSGGKPVAAAALGRASALLDAAVELHAAKQGRAGLTSTRIERRQG